MKLIVISIIDLTIYWVYYFKKGRVRVIAEDAKQAKKKAIQAFRTRYPDLKVDPYWFVSIPEDEPQPELAIEEYKRDSSKGI